MEISVFINKRYQKNIKLMIKDYIKNLIIEIKNKKLKL